MEPTPWGAVCASTFTGPGVRRRIAPAKTRQGRQLQVTQHVRSTAGRGEGDVNKRGLLTKEVDGRQRLYSISNLPGSVPEMVGLGAVTQGLEAAVG